MSNMPYPLNNFHVKESERRRPPRFPMQFNVPGTLVFVGNTALLALLSILIIGLGALLTTSGKISVSSEKRVSSTNVVQEALLSASDFGVFVHDSISSVITAPLNLRANVLSVGEAIPELSESVARSFYRFVSGLLDGSAPSARVTGNGDAEQVAGFKEAPIATSTDATEPIPALQQVTDTAASPERVVERFIERAPVISVSGISESELSARLQQMDNKYASKLAEITASGNQRIQETYHVISQTNKIDNLEGVTISGSTITNTTISGASTFSGTTGTFSGSLTVGGALVVTGSDISSVASDITFDTSTLVVDATNNRVGIGTTSPYAKLSVAGEVVGANFTATSTATSTFAGVLLASRIPQVAHSFSAWAVNAADAYPLTASLIVNPASASADTNLLALSIAGSAKFLVDAEGDVFANSVTAVGGTTLSTTTASTFSVENNTTLGDATTTDKTYFNSRIGTSLVPTVNNLLDLGDGANGLSWRTGFFATSVGIGTSSPFTTLSVAGIGSFDDYARASYFSATSTTATSTFAGGATFATGGGNVGVGTTSPWATLAVELGTAPGFVVGNEGSTTPAFYIAGVNGDGGVGVNTTGGAGRRLDVLDVANPQLRLSQSSTTASVYTDFQVAAATGDLTLSLYPSTSANDIFLVQPGGTIGANLWVCQGSACPSLTITNGGNVIAENAYYFGNGYKLDQVAGTTTEIGVYNTAGTAVIIFDEY